MSSLLDNNFNTKWKCKDILKEKISEFVKPMCNKWVECGFVLQSREPKYIECCWDKILEEPEKYYIYTRIVAQVFVIHIGKISCSLKGNKYYSYYLADKRNLKQIIEL